MSKKITYLEFGLGSLVCFLEGLLILIGQILLSLLKVISEWVFEIQLRPLLSQYYPPVPGLSLVRNFRSKSSVMDDAALLLLNLDIGFRIFESPLLKC